MPTSGHTISTLANVGSETNAKLQAEDEADEMGRLPSGASVVEIDISSTSPIGRMTVPEELDVPATNELVVSTSLWDRIMGNMWCGERCLQCEVGEDVGKLLGARIGRNVGDDDATRGHALVVLRD